jgi:hypothetical protein
LLIRRLDLLDSGEFSVELLDERWEGRGDLKGAFRATWTGATFASDRRRMIVAGRVWKLAPSGAFGRMIFRVQFLDGSARVIA